MRVLQIISSSRTSGAERHMVVLSAHLRRLGHEVTAICPPGGWISRQLASAGVPALEWPMHGWRAPATVLNLRTYLRETGIEIVHTHLTRATYMGYIAGLLAGVPVVSTMHTLNRDWAYRCLPCRNHWFVAVSHDLERAMARRGVDPGRMRVVYNGTDLIRPENDTGVAVAQTRRELGLPEQAFVIGVFSRVDEFKGQHILVVALRDIVSSCPEAHLLLVGHASLSQRQKLYDLAKREGLENRLVFTGVRDDVARLMLASDVIALTSVTEACSMAIIEAMAMGRPVVATSAGGNPELVQEGVTGFLVERVPEAAASAIVTLAQDPTLRARMGNAARERAAALFSAERMARDMEAFYRDIVQRRDITGA